MSRERGIVHPVIFRGQEAECVFFDPVANTTCWHRIKPSKTVRNNRNLQIFLKKWQSVIYDFLEGESMDENLYFLDVNSLRTHLYDLWYEYKHNAFQSYDQADPLYEVNEETWERNLRRLDAFGRDIRVWQLLHRHRLCVQDVGRETGLGQQIHVLDHRKKNSESTARL